MEAQGQQGTVREQRALRRCHECTPLGRGLVHQRGCGHSLVGTALKGEVGKRMGLSNGAHEYVLVVPVADMSERMELLGTFFADTPVLLDVLKVGEPPLVHEECEGEGGAAWFLIAYFGSDGHVVKDAAAELTSFECVDALLMGGPGTRGHGQNLCEGLGAALGILPGVLDRDIANGDAVKELVVCEVFNDSEGGRMEVPEGTDASYEGATKGVVELHATILGDEQGRIGGVGAGGEVDPRIVVDVLWNWHRE